MRTRLGGAGDWALALPTHYIAGLMVLARACLDRSAPHQWLDLTTCRR